MKAKSKRILLAAVSAALIGVMGAAGTFAYLQDSTEDVVNTFGTNKVEVSLTETDQDGNPVTVRDDYNIIPGTSQKKDPTVTVNATLPAYVYLEVTDTANADGKTLIDYTIDPDIWTPLGDAYPNVYVHKTDGGDGAEELKVLVNDTVSYPAGLTNEDMPDSEAPLTLSFKASAIQQEGFENEIAGYLQIPATVSDPEELEAALKSTAAGKTVQLTDDIEFPSAGEGELHVVDMPEGSSIDLNGHTVTVPFMSAIFQGNDFTISGGNFTTGEGTSYALWIGDEEVSQDVVVENVSVTGGINIYNAHNVVLRNVTVDAGSRDYYAVWADENAQVVIESGTYIGGTNNGTAMPAVLAYEGEGDEMTSITIKGGTFNNNMNLDKYIADGYEVVEEQIDGVTWYSVVEKKGE